MLSGENSSKISNNPPAVCTNTFVVQKHYDDNTSSEIRLSLIEDMKLEILEEFQNSTEIISSGSSCDVIPDKRLKGYFCSESSI